MSLTKMFCVAWLYFSICLLCLYFPCYSIYRPCKFLCNQIYYSRCFVFFHIDVPWKINFAQKEICLKRGLPFALGRYLLKPWNVLSDKDIFAYVRALGNTRWSMQIMWFIVGRGAQTMWHQFNLWEGWALRSFFQIVNYIFVNGALVKSLSAKA